MAERLIHMRPILKPSDSIYLRYDPTASHYIKVMMDGIFGHRNFRDEIVWKRAEGRAKGSQHKARTFRRDVDFPRFGFKLSSRRRRSETKAWKITLQNETGAKEFFVSPFDIGLGRCKPLSREAAFVGNILAEIFGAITDPRTSALIDSLISNLYRNFSDMEVTNNCRLWQPDKDADLDKELAAPGIKVHVHRTWWGIVDELMMGRRTDLAARAQRYAMSTLNDIITELVNINLLERFGGLCDAFKVQTEAAVNRYTLFSNEIRLDLGEARVVAIDPESVVQKSPRNDADRQRNTLMFLIARDLFVRKVSGSADEIQLMELPRDPELNRLYKEYWGKVFSEVTTIRKRFCIDEFHITGASMPMVNQVNQDVRHRRNWGLRTGSGLTAGQGLFQPD